MSLIQAALDKAEKKDRNLPVSIPAAAVPPPPARKLPKADLTAERTPAMPSPPPAKPAALLPQAALNAARKEASFMNLDPVLQDMRRRRGFFARLADPRIILGGLALLLLFYFFSRALVTVPPAPQSPVAVSSGEIPSAALQAPAAPVVAPRPVVVKPAAIVESRPRLLQPASRIRLTLTGITVAGSDRLAVINNQVLSRGDRMREGAIVKAIGENTVTVSFEGRDTVLTL